MAASRLLLPLCVSSLLLVACGPRATPASNREAGAPAGSGETRPETRPSEAAAARIADSGLTAEAAAHPDYARHLKRLERTVPSGFTVVVQKPFVVVGDEAPEMVEKRARYIVGWAVDVLKRDFFARDPEQIIDIWLFKDDTSYRRHAREIFGDTPTSPYGYYSEAHQALIMNIATGGGTLVHEIVHPYVHANFPDCPPWLNEGLGSLFEASTEVAGHIRGLTNWRLPILQKAIRAGTLLSFERLTALGAGEFYGPGSGSHYAQARYLCYYLQERGLLLRFYHRFHEERKKDPTGYRTLRKVLGAKDMDAFQRRWEAWVMKLHWR